MATLNPYIAFKGQAREALEFYRSALGGELSIMSYTDLGEAMPAPPGAEDLVMHGQLTLEDGLVLMASDTPEGVDYEAPTSGVTVAMTGSADELDRLRGAFDALSQGGTPGVPLEKALWGDYFGQFTDRFGVTWMFDIGEEAGG